MSYKKYLAVILLLLPLSKIAAQNNTETRSYIKSFPTDKETSLEVNNKYGTVQITSWNKDSVLIRAEIKAYATSDEKLNKMFQGVSVKVTESKPVIIAKTDFAQNMLFENFKGMTGKIISYDSRVEINYYINIPEYLDLKIDNKYGDVYMESNKGVFSVTVTNGSFKADALGKGSSLNLAFSDAVITSVASGKIEASFSEITISQTEDMSISSISSKYKIDNVGLLRLESRRDDFTIESIESLEGNSYFTDYEIDSLKKNINLTTRYGNLNIGNIEDGFGSLNLNTGYSDISLGFDPVSAYRIDIRTLNSYLLLPSKNVKAEKKILNEEKKEYIYTGTAGNNPGKSLLKIDANRGKIYLK